MFSRTVLAGLLFCCAPAGAQQKSPPPPAGDEPPSLELLEFLADFGAIDEQTWQLLEYHAQRDLENTPKAEEAEDED